MALATISGAALKDALKPQLTLLVDDMRAKLTADPAELERWRATHRKAVAEQRTAVSWTDWSEDQLTQAAVGWLLTSVFVRFCEDNLLLGDTAVWITHPDPMLRQRAIDAEQAFYRSDSNHSYREWLKQSFDALRQFPATQSLVDEHAALNIIAPTSDAVHHVLSFWRQVDDNGELAWTFRDEELSTRFLGDLYQDLSDFAKDKYALLQTPEFVEEFILDQTLEPALNDRALEGFKVIDPTCGSGHFLLGAFTRLVDRWHREAPGLDLRKRVDNALSSVYGVDLNPFAVAIAKFRLIVAALKSCGETNLVNAPKFTLNLANGDSLLHGPEQGGANALEYGDPSFNKDTVVSGFAYSTEDVALLRKMLAPGQYDVVVGNPPYITVKDKALNTRYREIYHYCKGKYALTVPFMEKFYGLAKAQDRGGWVGQITSNSFMKRDFGEPLIENFLRGVDLRLIVDTSGVYIPGHGTPTAIIIGRNAPRIRESVITVRGIQGEIKKPSTPDQGRVWKSISKNFDRIGHSDQWITVSDLPRRYLDNHPWSLSADAFELLDAIAQKNLPTVSQYAERVGFFGITGASEMMIYPAGHGRRHSLPDNYCRPLSTGDDVRDYSVSSNEEVWFPYDECHNIVDSIDMPDWMKHLWPYRTIAGNRATFSRGTYFSDNKPWYQWHQLPKDPSETTLCFAEQATHNHFSLVHRSHAFTQKAPIIRLTTRTPDQESYFRLFGALNSSFACFWLRQNSYCKDGSGEQWGQRYEFSGSTVGRYPIPSSTNSLRGRHIDSLENALNLHDSQAISHDTQSSLEGLLEYSDYESTRSLMIAEQEEIDWETYHSLGLIDDELFMPVGSAPGISLGERAFEIALARSMAANETETEWFVRHGSNPITKVPSDWPDKYRQLIEKRLQVIECNPFIRLLERPEYKRRWATESLDVGLQRRLKDWLLSRLEDRSLWFTQQGTPQMLSVAELAGRVEKDPEFITALDLWAGKKDSPVTETLVKLLADEAVPYLAAMRYKESGLRKRAEWERVWDLQRDEDAGLIKATDIPVPPKYTSGDFLKSSYWSHRGKLDAPKERFISYPGAGRATDPTPLLGWAGWNHAQQGLALATIYALREQEGTALTELVPVVAGIAEVLPWVKQWHSGVDPTFGIDLADYLTGQLNEKSAAVGVPVPDLGNWRPPKATRGRKAKA
ncbi:BREX-2 system adenine-specific DNA-methyltransferase PglX [Rhodococcus hoagii]|nr:BREX-2 system adenine-specific DNA-methyltransferase PglX [Prescottella equi]